MAKLTHKQRRVAHHIISVGRKKGASRKEILSALSTALVEANLGNPNYGDRDSVGWRQERSHYGPASKRLNVRGAAGRYFDETRAKGRGRGMSVGQLSQAVQRSAYPGRYDQRVGQAKAVLAAVGGGGGRGSRWRKTGSTPPKFNPGSEKTDWDSAIMESLVAGASGRRRGSLLKDVMRKVDTGQYTTKTDPSVTPGRPGREKPAGKGYGLPGGKVPVREGGGWGGSEAIAKAFAKGSGLKVTSEKRNRRLTASGNVSDHSVENKNAYAVDLSGSVAQMNRAAYGAAKRLGIKGYRPGQIYNVTKKVGKGTYRFQLIWGTGDHRDHVHIGVKRVG